MQSEKVTVDLSDDHVKFTKRYVIKKLTIGSLVDLIDKFFGRDIGQEVIYRKRSLDELTEIAMRSVTSKVKIAEERMENLQYQLQYLIGKQENALVVFDNVLIKLKVV